MVGASVSGTSHERLGSRCQDACRFETFDGADGRIALLAVSDGAGSAERSHAGALRAVDAAVEFLRERLEMDAADPLDGGALHAAVAYAQSAVAAHALGLDVPLRELSCTLLVAVLTPGRTWAAHVGDGAIVVDDGGEGLRALSWPEQGEYANATPFLTDDDALDHVRYAESGGAARLALLSDGLQALALRYDDGTPFDGFFEPFFAHLETSDAADDAIVRELERYLASDAVSARTDDDKTLVLAVRR